MNKDVILCFDKLGRVLSRTKRSRSLSVWDATILVRLVKCFRSGASLTAGLLIASWEDLRSEDPVVSEVACREWIALLSIRLTPDEAETFVMLAAGWQAFAC